MYNRFMNKKNVDVLVIGSGPAGLLTSILAQEKRKVTLIEKPAKEFKLAKRILVSGNGRANFFNQNLLDGRIEQNIFLSSWMNLISMLKILSPT